MAETLRAYARRTRDPVFASLDLLRPQVGLDVLDDGTVPLAVLKCVITRSTAGCRDIVGMFFWLGLKYGYPVAADWWNASAVPWFASKGMSAPTLPSSWSTVGPKIVYWFQTLWKLLGDEFGIGAPPTLPPGIRSPTQLAPTKAGKGASGESNAGWWLLGGGAVVAVIAAIAWGSKKGRRRK